MNNVETMSNLPWIVDNGGEAFAALGQGTSTGTRAVRPLGSGQTDPAGTSSRCRRRPSATSSSIPPSAAGVSDGRALKAFIPGGVSAPWFGPEQLDLGLDQDAVGKAGSMLGSGSVVVMDETTCAVRAAWRITRFFHRESCGQCTPCREGGSWLEKIMRRIEEGERPRGGSRPADGRLRQHRARGQLAAAADDDLRARTVDPLLDRLGHPDVPRRVPRCT